MKHARLSLLFFFLITVISCKRNKPGLPFEQVKGIHFNEVRRVFSDGLVFDKQGYQLEPVWKFHFISNDSVQVYSPKKQKYYGFHVYYDHDQIFNMIDSWLVLQETTFANLEPLDHKLPPHLPQPASQRPATTQPDAQTMLPNPV